MRITYPNCTAGFEIPTELLGRKGRSLKCATCGHSWFQAAIVDEIDLGDILGDGAAAQDMGGPKGGKPEQDQSITQAVAAAANAAMVMSGSDMAAAGAPDVQAAQLGQGGNQGAPQAGNVPPGATSLLDRDDAGQMGQAAPAQSMR